MKKPTVMIVKSSPWKSAPLSRDHPEYSVIRKVIHRYKDRVRFVLVGTSKSRTEAISFGADIIAWDVQVESGPNLKFYLDLLKIFLKYRPHLAIVAGLETLMPFLVFSFLSFRSKCSLLVTGGFNYYGRRLGGKLLHYSNLKLLSIVLRISDVKLLNIFFLSRYSRDGIEKMAPNLHDKITLISYPISQIFRPSTTSADTSVATPVLLTVAGIEQRKGLDILIQAVASIPRELRLKVIIKGSVRDPVYMQKLNDLVQGLNLEDRVVFNTTEIDYKNLPTYYQSAAFFILPTRDDCLPIVLLEALHSGLPVIASSVGGNSDLILDGQNGLLVKPDNPAALADAMLLLLRNNALRMKLASNSTKTLDEHYYKNRFTLEEAIDSSVAHVLIERE